MNYIFKYGSVDDMVDISEICLKRLCHNNLIMIPNCDIMIKHILRKENEMFDNKEVDIKTIHIYENNNLIYNNPHKSHILIDFDKNMMYIGVFPEDIVDKIYKSNFVEHKLWYIQSQLKLVTGFFYEEYPEQLFSTEFLTGDEKILELGGNIGRNSLVIGYILNKCNNNNFVTLETSEQYCDILAYHRQVNNLNFYIENSALSKRKLIQQGWNTMPSDIILDGWVNVNTITYNELCEKYKIQFDTLIIDCEGAFFQILIDMPDMLSNIKTIIVENDYTELWKKECVDYILKQNGFNMIKLLPLGLPIDWIVCPDNFYEVWKR